MEKSEQYQLFLAQRTITTTDDSAFYPQDGRPVSWGDI